MVRDLLRAERQGPDLPITTTTERHTYNLDRRRLTMLFEARAFLFLVRRELLRISCEKN